MADKARSIVTVVPTFVDGEAPSAAKLNTLGAVIKYLSASTELFVGDLWGESWPYSVYNTSKLTLPFGRKETSDAVVTLGVDRFLDIANLARIIGPAAQLNPRVLEDTTIVDNVPDSGNSFVLSYVPAEPDDVIFSDSVVFNTLVASHDLIAVAGDYFVSDTGEVFTWSDMGGGIATYEIVPSAWGGGEAYTGSRFNVIPDPAQCENGLGLTVGALAGDGTRILTLPVVTHIWSSNDGQNALTSDTDAVNGLQLTLPKVLVDNFIAGEEIPKGFLYVKNWTTGQIYKDAIYYYVSETQIKIGNVDLSNAVGAGDILYIITIGTDITTSIADLRQKSKHSHDRRYGETPVDIASISGIYKYAAQSGIFVESEIPGNFMPQYLHRDGWVSGVDSGSNDENVMRGHLALGATVSGLSPNNEAGQASTNTAVPSHKVLFLGSNVAGVTPFIRQSNDGLELNANAPSSDYGATISVAEAGGDYGVRVKNGHFIPEHGISGGRTYLERPVIPVAYNGTFTDTFTVLSFGDYPITDYKLMDVNVSVQIDSEGTYYKHGSDIASHGFDISWDPSVSNTVSLVCTGSSFTGGQPKSFIVVAWFNRLG